MWLALLVEACNMFLLLLLGLDGVTVSLVRLLQDGHAGL